MSEDLKLAIQAAKEAGALITDWQGKHWKNENSYILATNSELHEKILERLSGIQ